MFVRRIARRIKKYNVIQTDVVLLDFLAIPREKFLFGSRGFATNRWKRK